jgi:putative ATP-dependent endonuclease of OLD family
MIGQTSSHAQAKRPEVHKVDAFSHPDKQTDAILSILQDYVIGRLLSPAEDETGAKIKGYQEIILKQIGEVRKTLTTAADDEIKDVESELSKMVSQVFPNYQVKFENSPEETNTSFLASVLKKEARLKMGPIGDFQSPLELQGSGARRTLLWSILRLIAEKKLDTSKTKKGKVSSSSKPHVLLLDEPEICLHPSAIRDACKTLYDLPKSGRWQVMVTTHCPIFVDLGRDNTTIVRVERSTTGVVQGTTIYRPKDLKLSQDQSRLVKMLNVYDPYVAEFFFGGRTVIVEGDTEYSAFKYLSAMYPEEYRDVHIVKARGKATIILLVKILEKFSTRFAVLHDADVPKVTTKNGERTNAAWTLNTNIREACSEGIAAGRIRLVASVTTFEVAYFGEEQSGEKPYHTLEVIKNDKSSMSTIKMLLDALLDEQKKLPANAVAWKDLADLNFAPHAVVKSTKDDNIIAMPAPPDTVMDYLIEDIAAAAKPDK